MRAEVTKEGSDEHTRICEIDPFLSHLNRIIEEERLMSAIIQEEKFEAIEITPVDAIRRERFGTTCVLYSARDLDSHPARKSTADLPNKPALAIDFLAYIDCAIKLKSATILYPLSGSIPVYEQQARLHSAGRRRGVLIRTYRWGDYYAIQFRGRE